MEPLTGDRSSERSRYRSAPRLLPFVAWDPQRTRRPDVHESTFGLAGPGVAEPQLPHGEARGLRSLVSEEQHVACDLWSCMLRDRDDGSGCCGLRPRAVRHGGLPAIA